MTNLVIKRVYDEVLPTDGYRILVDRLWPRGISKEIAKIDEWNKEVAPSTELRKWFHHDPKKWKEFSGKYLEELKANNIAETFWEVHKKQEKITLVYSAKDEKHCHPLVLLKYLENETDSNK